MSTPPILCLEHRPPRRARRSVLPSAWDLARAAFFVAGIPRNFFGSIDITAECNLRCRHCYFFEHPRPCAALNSGQWMDLLESWKRTRPRREFPFYSCSWVGGEPLIRRELIERARRLFRYNTIVTNGTIPLPDWPDVDWYVSIDGDEPLHDSLRGKPGLYRRAMQHVRERPGQCVTLAYCITRENAAAIERVVHDWAPLVSYFTFDFYTPLAGNDDDPLWVPWEERDRVIDLLIALHRVYRPWFRMPERAFGLMRSARAPRVTRNCLFASKAFAYDAAGKPKEKCVMGATADCSRCGCVVPFYMRSLVDRPLILKDLAAGALRAALPATRGRA